MSEIKLDSLQKLESSSVSKPEIDDDKLVDAIIKVRDENYVPEGVKLRAKIDPYLFTCTILGANLSDLEQDPGVLSIALETQLRNIEGREDTTENKDEIPSMDEKTND